MNDLIWVPDDDLQINKKLLTIPTPVWVLPRGRTVFGGSGGMGLMNYLILEVKLEDVIRALGPPGSLLRSRGMCWRGLGVDLRMNGLHGALGYHLQVDRAPPGSLQAIRVALGSVPRCRKSGLGQNVRYSVRRL